MSEIIVEILDDPQATALVADGSSTLRLEIEVQQDVSSYSLPVQEFIEISELGPTGDPATANALLFIIHDGVEYAERSTVTTDPTRPVVWMGPVAPTIGGNFALDDIDHWWNTAG